MAGSGRKGFTLIEIMIAIAILAIISLLLWQSSAVSMNAKERYEAEDVRFQEVLLALSRMADDISMAYLFQSKAHLGNTGIGELAQEVQFIGTDSGERDEIHFVSLSHMRYLKNTKESDQEEVSYFLRREEGEEGEKGRWDLVRRMQSPPDREPEKGGRDYVILQDVQKLEFQFFDEKRGEWQREWDSSRIESNRQLPKAVEITLTIPDPVEPEEAEPRSFTTTALVEMAPGPNDF